MPGMEMFHETLGEIDVAIQVLLPNGPHLPATMKVMLLDKSPAGDQLSTNHLVSMAIIVKAVTEYAAREYGIAAVEMFGGTLGMGGADGYERN